MKAILIALGGLLASCSENHTKQPGELNGCTPIDDASCGTSIIGGGSMQGPGDSGATSDADASGSTQAGCGNADSLVNAMNVMTCEMCARANCCTADQACGLDCQALLVKVQACAQGDTACVMAGEQLYQAALTAYQDFANCLSMQCSPMCPTLQQ